MNLLIWMVLGMVIGCSMQMVGRVRDEVAIVGGLFAGAAGAMVGGVLVTDSSVAMQLFGQSISASGLLAAVVGAAASSVVLRVLWRRRPDRQASLSAAADADDVRSRPADPEPAYDDHVAPDFASAGDTEPAAFRDWHAQANRPRTPPRNDRRVSGGAARSDPVHDL